MHAARELLGAFGGLLGMLSSRNGGWGGELGWWVGGC
jgi:hypothetical protein